MEIVNINAETFEKMLSMFEDFASRIEYLCRLHGDRDMKEWLDNQDVCRLLDISPSKLITLRRSGAVAYSRIDRKIFYKREDIRKFIERELQKQGKA